MGEDLTQIFRNFINFAFSMVLACVLGSWELALVCFALVPFMVYSSLAGTKTNRQVASQSSNQMAQVSIIYRALVK